jgi:ATP synthase I chain
MNRLAELFEQITLPEIQRLLRKTVFSAIGVGAVALVVAGLLGHLLFGVGVSIGLALGILNVRLITQQTAKVSDSGTTKPVRALAKMTLYRLIATTVVIVAMALIAEQLGFGTVGGVALFYFVFLANLVIPIARKGWAA